MSRRASSPIPSLRVLLFSVLLWGLLPVSAHAQEGEPWWPPVSVEREVQEDDRYDRRARYDNPRGPRVPKGHLPPPEECRLWMPGQPPGQQPPPMACEEAVRHQGPSEIVVSHDGSVYGRAARTAGLDRWARRPAGDIVFRRSPRRDGRVTISVDILIDLLGERGYERLLDQRRRAGVTGELTGRWVSTGRSGSTVLQVRAGQSPLAELADSNGDGRIDLLFVRESRR